MSKLITLLNQLEDLREEIQFTQTESKLNASDIEQKVNELTNKFSMIEQLVELEENKIYYDYYNNEIKNICITDRSLTYLYSKNVAIKEYLIKQLKNGAIYVFDFNQFKEMMTTKKLELCL